MLTIIYMIENTKGDLIQETLYRDQKYFFI